MKKWILLLLVMPCLMACEDKKSCLSDFETFIEKIEEEFEDFSQKDWEDADKEFAHLTKKAESFMEEFSIEEKVEMAKYQAVYAAIKAKAGIEKVGEHLEKAGEKLEKVFDED